MRTWLQKLRNEHQLSCLEMANRLEIGPETYEALESGQEVAAMPALVAAKLSDQFELPISRIMIYEEENAETSY